nr:MAG TPA: hypothetical protein [Caudoviricetes sp.]
MLLGMGVGQKKWSSGRHTYCGLFLGIATKGQGWTIFMIKHILID